MTRNWNETMEKKLGGKEAVSKHMSKLAKSKKGIKSPKSGTAALSPEERSRRGREAAKARWQNRNSTTSS